MEQTMERVRQYIRPQSLVFALALVTILLTGDDTSLLIALTASSGLSTNALSARMYVPAGEFIMGGDTTKEGRGGVETSAQGEIYLPAYWISRTQVTNWQYSRCVAAGVCRVHVQQELNPHYYSLVFGNHPVVYVDWYEAEDYCHWQGGRLPTEAEWEKAARGTDGRSYPWGEEGEVVRLARIGRSRETRTTRPVGSYPLGASPYGVLDMGGNVREWVDDWYDAERKVLRGAAWFDPLAYSLTFSRLSHQPDSPGYNRGFRCVWDE